MSEPKNLKKGDLLVREGDSSNSMYWLQSGTLRLFKRKGTGFIELGVIYSGEVVGEMSFLDNQPRSASVEALMPSVVVEIPRGNFDEVLASQPGWLKSLVNTLVKRLRVTSNRVRELESSSTVYGKDEDGRTTKVHEFLSTAEILKLSSAVLLAGARNSEKGEGPVRVKASWVQYYGGNIFGVQVAKIQVFINLLNEAEVIAIHKNGDRVELELRNPDLLEKFIHFAHEEAGKTEDKQLPITGKGIAILEAVFKHSNLAKVPLSPEKLSVNVGNVFAQAPFDWAGFDELVKCDFSDEVRISGNDKTANFAVARFQKLYPVLWLRQKFRDLNAQKRDS